MSKKHFNLYYLQVASQMFEYQKMLNKLREASKDIRLTEEERDEYLKLYKVKEQQFLPEIERLQRDFSILSQATYYLNLPNREEKNNRVLSNSVMKSYEESFIRQGIDVESLRNENKNVLDNYKAYTDEIEKFFNQIRENMKEEEENDK